MNELKPEDVMKALECFANGKRCEGEQCAYFKLRVGFCGSDLAKDALALLREKDAEIERLTAYIQRCKSGEEYWVKCLLERPQEARAEAITEFAERLKSKCDAPHWCVWLSEIEDLENEMKGATDGKSDL